MLKIIIIFLAGVIILVKCTSDPEKTTSEKTNNSFSHKETCGRWIKSVATHPSTVDLHYFLGSSVSERLNGNFLVRLDFDAKNSYGLELTKTAYCLIAPNGDFIEGSIK